MALNKSSLMIRDYENIRHILRDIYIFGCFSRDDFIEKKGISGRKYDKEQQRIRAYLPKKFIKRRRVDKRVQLYCSYSMTDGARNYLEDTYRNKSFTALDIMAFFFIQQLLGRNVEMSAAEILNSLPVMNTEVIFTKDNLRIKLDELVEKGYINCRKKGRKVLFRLCDDIWRDFGNDELLDICTYLEFMKNVSPLEMPYYFLHQKLCLYLYSNRGIDTDETGLFHFKHNHLFNVLDNDILLAILKAQEKKTLVHMTFCGNDKKCLAIPIELIHDSIYGRQYLYCYDINSQTDSVFRLDHISSVTQGREQSASEKETAEKYRGFSNECWCTSGAVTELSEIVIEFRFDEEKEHYILDRLSCEGHGGEVVKKDVGIYEFRLKLRDPDEMIPWIRSFGERARVISSGAKKTELKIAEDWKKALEKYDSL